MDSEEDIKVAQTLMIEESLAELFNFVEQLEQQVKHHQYCCHEAIEVNELACASDLNEDAIAQTQSFDITTDDELRFDNSYI